MSNATRILGKVALVAGGLLAGVLLAETMARFISPAGNADLLFNAPDASPFGLYVNDPELMVVPAPNFRGDVGSLGYQVPLEINSLGLRGPELDATTGRARWVAAGDSFTIAVQVPYADTFGARVAQAKGVDVLNAGVDGYSTWQSTGRYERLEASPGVDGVLLMFFLGNDLQDNVHFPYIVQQARNHEPGTPIPREPVSPIRRALMGNSYLFAHWVVWSRQRALQSGQDPAQQRWRDELSIFTPDGRRRLEELVQKSERPLAQLRDQTRKNGDRLIVAIAPPAFEVEPHRLDATFSVMGLDPTTADVDAPSRAVTALLRRLGIQSCDLVAPLRAAHDAGESLYFTYDGHWTTAGHAVVADTLGGCMDRKR